MRQPGETKTLPAAVTLDLELSALSARNDLQSGEITLLPISPRTPFIPANTREFQTSVPFSALSIEQAYVIPPSPPVTGP